MNYGKLMDEVDELKELGLSVGCIIRMLEDRHLKGAPGGRSWAVALDVILAACGHYQMTNDPEELRSSSGIANFYKTLDEEKPPA